MHVVVYPGDGRCLCDSMRGWYPDPDNQFDCVCQREWLTNLGECTSCPQAFPGCSQCSRVSTKDSLSGGKAVIQNTKFNSSIQTGTYICSACSEPTTFFNFEYAQCFPCDRDLNGCAKCSQSGKCSECLAGFALDSNSGCFDCTWHSTGCASCSETECNRCKAGFTTFGGLAGDCSSKIF